MMTFRQFLLAERQMLSNRKLQSIQFLSVPNNPVNTTGVVGYYAVGTACQNNQEVQIKIVDTLQIGAVCPPPAPGMPGAAHAPVGPGGAAPVGPGGAAPAPGTPGAAVPPSPMPSCMNPEMKIIIERAIFDIQVCGNGNACQA